MAHMKQTETRSTEGHWKELIMTHYDDKLITISNLNVTPPMADGQFWMDGLT
jgi:hypothetical protein